MCGSVRTILRGCSPTSTRRCTAEKQGGRGGRRHPPAPVLCAINDPLRDAVRVPHWKASYPQVRFSRSRLTLTLPSAFITHTAVSCAVIVEPSDPVAWIVSVNSLFAFLSFMLRLPPGRGPAADRGTGPVIDAPPDRAGLGEREPDLVAGREEGDVADHVAVEPDPLAAVERVPPVHGLLAAGS